MNRKRRCTMAASVRRAQEAIRGHGSNKCPKHNGKEVLFLCEDCDILVCADCVGQQHKRHGLEGLGTVTPSLKEKLLAFITRTEEEDIPRVKREFQKVTEHLSENKANFQKKVSQIKKGNDIVKKELDEITNAFVKSWHDVEQRNSDTILDHQRELQTQLDKLCSKVQEVKTILQSGSDVLVYDTARVIPIKSENLPISSCYNAEFAVGDFALEQFVDKRNIIHHYYQNMVLHLSTTQKVTSEFTPFEGQNARSIHLADDKAWLIFYSSINDKSVDQMLAVDEKGQVLQLLKTDVNVKDFSISPQTGNIWFCSDRDFSVREVKNNRTHVKFTTDTYPFCICNTKDDNVLVGFDGKIVKYTQDGQKICRTLGGTAPTVRRPCRISECPITRHVAVADKEGSGKGNEHPFVSILNDKLQLLHIYRGELSNRQTLPSPLNPQDVQFTLTGELVVTDRNNKSVLLVTGTGMYLKTLYVTSESEPVAACVNNGALWVTFYDGKVRIFEYEF